MNSTIVRIGICLGVIGFTVGVGVAEFFKKKENDQLTKDLLKSHADFLHKQLLKEMKKNEELKNALLKREEA